MLPPWMPRLSTSLSHLKDIHTSMSYWFMNKLSTTYNAHTLSQFVATPLLEECDDTHTLEMGTWESSETPETSKFNGRGQNTSP